MRQPILPIKQFQEKVASAWKSYQEEEKFWRLLDSVLTVFALLVLLVFAIRPTVLTIISLWGEINDKRELNKKMGQKISDILIAQAQYAQLQEKLTLLDQFYPLTPQVAAGAAQVIGLANQTGFQIENFGLGEVAFPFSKGEVEFRMKGKGSFPVIKDFLDQFAKFRRAHQWTTVSFEKDEEEPTVIHLQLTGLLFFQK